MARPEADGGKGEEVDIITYTKKKGLMEWECATSTKRGWTV